MCVRPARELLDMQRLLKDADVERATLRKFEARVAELEKEKIDTWRTQQVHQVPAWHVAIGQCDPYAMDFTRQRRQSVEGIQQWQQVGQQHT